MTTVVMRFDFRCPPGNATPAEELYRAALEMAAYADGRGVDVLGLSEHHSTDDGYLSAPLTVATAMAACTSRAMISIAALLVPLYDPIKLAEDLAVLDIIARGRLMVIAGIDDQSLVDAYNEECRRRSFAGGFVMLPNYPSTTYIADDVEAGWREIGEFMLYDALAYGAWRHATRRAYVESFARDLASLREEGKYRVLSPEQAVAEIRQTGSLHLSPLVGGCPPALGWKSLRLFTEQVAPHIRSQEEAKA